MITSRADLITYCLRRLGAPVIAINIAEEQLNDRIDDAIQYYTEFHSDGVERTYLNHKVTANHLQLTTNVASSFQASEIITGSVSCASMELYDAPELNKIRAKLFNGTFIVGETVTGAESGTTAIITPNGIYIGDIQNRFVEVPEAVVSVLRVIPITNNSSSTAYMFDAKYQIMANDILALRQGSGLDYYTGAMQHLALIDFTLNTKTSVSFSRASGKINIYSDLNSLVEPDQYIVFEVYAAVESGTITRMFNDIFLKQYATAMIKRQWGENLSKYSGVDLPGGIKLNGAEILTSAITELDKLETQMHDKYSAPLSFMMG